MSRASTLITVGILIALSPFLGLPQSWFAFFIPIMGIVTLLIGYLIRKEHATVAPIEVASAPAVHIHDAPSPIA